MWDDEDSNYRLYKGFKLDRRDPYGLWFIEKVEGKTPNDLNSSFTTTDNARKAIDVYLDNQSKLSLKETKKKV